MSRNGWGLGAAWSARMWLAVAWLACGSGAAFAQMSESFEYGVPPPGWTKTNLLGGNGWYQLPIGVMPLPGWGNGTSSVPATANAGTHNAYCSWTTGGGAADGYHNDQWLISPRLTGLTATSTVSYWLRFAFTNFPDTVYFRVSTNGPAPANFTFVPLTNVFARASYPNQFPPWSNHVVNVGALGIPAGTPIWIAIHEYEWDNTHNGAAIQLDVIDSDLTAPPEARVGPTSLVFTAYYEGADPAPQTFTLQSVGSSGLGYSSAVAFGAGPTDWLTVGGPASGTLGFQGSQVCTASVSAAGLDLGTYYATNVFTVPGATNSPLRVPITLNVIRRPQTISFSNPGPQYTTNQVGLAGTASSGLQVTFSVFSGPGSIVGATNLSFTGTGTVKVVAWQLGNVYYDVAPCVTQAMAVTKPNAAITITNLSHVYDGAPHGATVTTVPAGLAVVTTYNGGAALPVAIGSYAVTSTVNDVLYGGTATATYTITRMPQTVDFPDPGAQWTTSVVGLAATASSGLPVTFSVASGPGAIDGGTNLSFTGAGTVSVVATQAGDADWLPAAATNAVAVSKVAATVALGSLNQTYDGTAKSATATTDPAGLAVDFTYDGSGTAPTAAGSYAVTGTINDAIYHGTDAGTLAIAKAAATVTLTNLDQAYDGAPKFAAATTDPAGLAVDFTYDGSTNAPTARGGYAVTGTVNDVNWHGSATGMLLIGMGSATVILGDLEQGYDGTAKSATATTVPAGLAVDLTYDGATNAPIAVGSYAVTGTVNDADWLGSATGTLVIGKGTAAVTLGSLNQTYDGSAKHATATTDPAGLAVDLTYDGSATAPAAAGSYAVTGTVNEANWQGTNVGTLVIAKAGATVTLGSLNQTYDGTAKNATATTVPAGLAVDFTYDGSATAPTAAGSYAVTGTVNEANWQGSATGTLVVGKGTAAVTLGSLNQTYDGTAKSATASTMPAGLAVDFTYDGSATAPSAAGSYAVTGTVNEANWQGSATGTLVVGKGTATVTLGSLNQTYDGAAKSATATTVPAGLVVDLTYDGSATAPSAAGSYAVTGTVNEANWQGTNVGTLVVGKGTVTVTLGSLNQTYDGTAKSATATTVPAGLAVDFTYDGSATAPTAAGSYAVTGTVNEANWQGTNVGTLAIAKAGATVTLTNLDQTYDGTPKSAAATTDPAGLAVDFTYDGSATAPTAVGSYAVTGTVNEANWQGSAVGTLTIGKNSQVITDFLPADGAIFARGAGTTLTAQASSGLAVGFTNLTPEIADLAGAGITFTNYGLARIQAFQAGDANWAAAAPVTREYRVGAILTNVAPGRANVGGGIAVTIQGLWIGNGGDVASVTLAGVPAAIVTQSFHAVTVRPGLAAGAVTGDVVVTSASAGTLVLSNAFEYLWLDAPEQLDPTFITASNLVARWLTVPAAESHVLEVGLDTNFTAHLPGYEAVDVGFAEQYPVTGLSPGTWYAVRIFARDANGLGRPSRTVWVPAGANVPYATHPLPSGPVSQGAVMERALANMFNGTGLVYTAESSDTNVVGVAVAGGQLVLTPRNPGTATITVRATDPATGYTTGFSFEIQVVGAPALASASFLPRELWNPRFTQALQVRNDAGVDAVGVRLLFTNLMPGISVENRTGTAIDGRPMIEMETTFAAGATLDLNVVYLCTGAYTADLYPPAIELQYVLPEWTPPLPDGGVVIEGGPLSGGRFAVAFASIVGRLYAIEYMNDFPTGTWTEVPLRLRATANWTQWIDSGPPATQPLSGLRAYRVKELAE